MANDGSTKEQIHEWPYLSELDLSNSYNLYQRRYNRYPRRLPKISDYPTKSPSNRSSRKNDLEISTPPEEATASMPLTPIDHLFGTREKYCEKKDGMDEEIMKMTLEDFQDDEEVGVKDMHLPKPSSTSNMCGSPASVIKLNSLRSNESPSLSRRAEAVSVACLQSGVVQSSKKGKHRSHSSVVPSSPPASKRSPINPLQEKVIRSPTKKCFPKSHDLPVQPVPDRCNPTNPSLTAIPISNLGHNKKVNRRSHSLSVPKSYTGRSSPIQLLDDIGKSYSGSGKKVRLRSQSLCGQSSSPGSSPIHLRKQSPKPSSQSPTNESFNLISMLKSQKETSSIKKLMKSEKECPRIIAAQKRRHTFHSNLLSDGAVVRNKRGMKINNITSKMLNTYTSNDVKPTVNVKDVHQTPMEQEKEPIVVPQVSEKIIDTTSKDCFFHSCLMLADSQVKLLEDKSFEIYPVESGRQQIKGQPISSQVAFTLRTLLFGSASSSFSTYWRDQSISFVQPEHYGLKFHKDGPVELMTSLQAYVLRNLLFVDKAEKEFDPQQLAPSGALQFHILIMSICDMIWKVGEKVHAIVSLPNNTSHFIQEYCYKSDDITEKMELFRFTKRDNLELFMKQNIQKFMGIDCYGCISLLYSIMLTRGLSNLLNDCYERKQGILECSSQTERSQSLINLCIYGKAVPNVFNKDVEVYDESEDKIIIQKGVDKRSEIGYLSYSEFINSKICEVGSCLKTPRYPIWILDNNGTLSVLFSVKRNLLSDWRLERRFDLYYYQGIAKHVPTNEIDVRLTMNTIQTLVDNEYEDDMSTLEETLRTKWKDCVIEWNGYTRF